MKKELAEGSQGNSQVGERRRGEEGEEGEEEEEEEEDRADRLRWARGSGTSLGPQKPRAHFRRSSRKVGRLEASCQEDTPGVDYSDDLLGPTSSSAKGFSRKQICRASRRSWDDEWRGESSLLERQGSVRDGDFSVGRRDRGKEADDAIRIGASTQLGRIFGLVEGTATRFVRVRISLEKSRNVGARSRRIIGGYVWMAGNEQRSEASGVTDTRAVTATKLEEIAGGSDEGRTEVTRQNRAEGRHREDLRKGLRPIGECEDSRRRRTPLPSGFQLSTSDSADRSTRDELHRGGNPPGRNKTLGPEEGPGELAENGVEKVSQGRAFASPACPPRPPKGSLGRKSPRKRRARATNCAAQRAVNVRVRASSRADGTVATRGRVLQTTARPTRRNVSSATKAPAPSPILEPLLGSRFNPEERFARSVYRSKRSEPHVFSDPSEFLSPAPDNERRKFLRDRYSARPGETGR
ncbi:hypothetical protein KM043_000934 [Ampulex compressa]|nr:hypothetical protein KM043_000934 [Ampulex compressa]